MYIYGAHEVSGGGTATNETLLNGVKQGHSLASSDPRKASAISRANMLRLGQKTARLLLERCGTQLPVEVTEELRGVLSAQTYRDAKISGRIGLERKKAKEVVTTVLAGAGGWVRNGGDEDWSTPY